MMSMIPTISVKMSTCINPVLYIALNPQVREYDNTYFSDEYNFSGVLILNHDARQF